MALTALNFAATRQPIRAISCAETPRLAGIAKALGDELPAYGRSGGHSALAMATPHPPRYPQAVSPSGGVKSWSDTSLSVER